MKFYFSGVSSSSELDMLEAARVSHILLDPTQYTALGTDVPHGPDDYWEPSLALDSGAYRAFKKGTQVTPGDMERFIRHYEGYEWRSHTEEFDFIVAPDVIGDPYKTRENYVDINTRGLRSIPVWHWGEPREVLDSYLEFERLVGVGGLAGWMHQKNQPVLRDLIKLCSEYPGRFHLFGLAWPKAIDALNGLAHSADSSVWLRGAKYGYAIFKHSKHGHLTQAPARFIPEYKFLDREERCIQNARNIEEFCSG